MIKIAPARIMIVDDSKTIRAVLSSLFISENYNVIGGYDSGRNLLGAVARLNPDIICLDYNLPEANGLELLKDIHGSHPAVAIVMITGDKSLELEKAAAEAGASGFIRKPFTQKDIIKDLQKIVLAQRAISSTQQNKKDHSEESARASAVIADDSSTMRMLLASILEEANIKIVGEACDGKQAVELVVKHHPDFICLDIEMPVISGLEALKMIHAQQSTAKVLMITASADRECIIQAAKMGAKGYIVKPYQPTRVIDAITKLLDWDEKAT